ncbi:hypothetical protein DY000_02061899 [Brassica cretica]|uniref:Uncharacterized protein n=1 Tax=Brassica cretica TaxID=69181 RepID=A0ABQ7AWX9_BRACR|nr:hypothetical protein DY000_02061899 [Brassica cretica]
MKEKNEETNEKIRFSENLVSELMEEEKKPPPQKVEKKKKKQWDEEIWVKTAVERKL